MKKIPDVRRRQPVLLRAGIGHAKARGDAEQRFPQAAVVGQQDASTRRADGVHALEKILNICREMEAPVQHDTIRRRVPQLLESRDF